MYCNKCGAQLPDNARFCNNCGAKIDTSPAEPELEEEATIPEEAYTAPETTNYTPANDGYQNYGSYNAGNNSGSYNGSYNGSYSAPQQNYGAYSPEQGQNGYNNSYNPNAYGYPPQQPAPKKKSKLPLILGIVIGVLVIALIAAVIAVVAGGKNNKTPSNSAPKSVSTSVKAEEEPEPEPEPEDNLGAVCFSTLDQDGDPVTMTLFFEDDTVYAVEQTTVWDGGDDSEEFAQNVADFSAEMQEYYADYGFITYSLTIDGTILTEYYLILGLDDLDVISDVAELELLDIVPGTLISMTESRNNLLANGWTIDWEV